MEESPPQACHQAGQDRKRIGRSERRGVGVVTVVGPVPKGTPVKDGVDGKGAQYQHLDFGTRRQQRVPTQKDDRRVGGRIGRAPKGGCGRRRAVKVLDGAGGQKNVEENGR